MVTKQYRKIPVQRTERVDKPLVDEIIRAVSSDHKVYLS